MFVDIFVLMFLDIFVKSKSAVPLNSVFFCRIEPGWLCGCVGVFLCCVGVFLCFNVFYLQDLFFIAFRLPG